MLPLLLELREVTSKELLPTEADTADDEDMLPDPAVAHFEAQTALYLQQLQAPSDQVSAHLSEEAKLAIQNTVKESEKVNAAATADLKTIA